MKMHDILLSTHQKLSSTDTEGASGAIASLQAASKVPWQAAIIDVIMDAVSKHGWGGIEMARKAAIDIAEGDNPDLSFLSLRSMSDILCLRQMAEANRKDRINDFFAAVGHIVGKVMKAVVSSV